MSDASTIVLVHGAWAGGCSRWKVIPMLQEEVVILEVAAAVAGAWVML